MTRIARTHMTVASPFEAELNANMDSVLDVRLSSNVEAERNAEIPALLITPTCINDGRRVLVSSTPMAFMTSNTSELHMHNSPLPSTVEFSKIFAGKDPLNTKLTSALRMNATFPYIMPMVSLPSEPRMKMMDAGIRDNFGTSMTIKFVHELRDWIEENTNGVVVLQIRDRHKNYIDEPNDGSLLARIFRPVGNVTGNMLRIQDMEHDETLNEADSWASFPIDIVPIELHHDKDQNISLSWHLTAIEKQHVLEQITGKENVEQFKRLQQLLAPAESPALTVSGSGNSAGLQVGQAAP